jgi:predicted AAA+ superfamily ATPase
MSSNPGALDARLEARFGSSPAKGKIKTVFVDEVQRLPSLLNTIQAIVDLPKNDLLFLLTGSSARKLRRGQANLLPGRIHVHHLGPFTLAELEGAGVEVLDQDLLAHGTLPGILTDPSPASREKTLRSYAATYLREEIQAEALVRNIEGFSRFLSVAAEGVGRSIDFTKLASQAMIKRLQAVRYFEILEDTLLVSRVEAFSKSGKKRLVQHPKFYFFDVGVWNGLVGNFQVSADRIGTLFENLIYSLLRTELESREIPFRISTFRTTHGAEVDLIIEKGHGRSAEVIAVELKASRNVSAHDARGFESFAGYYGRKFHRVVFYLGAVAKRFGEVDVLPWREGIRRCTAI